MIVDPELLICYARIMLHFMMYNEKASIYQVIITLLLIYSCIMLPRYLLCLLLLPFLFFTPTSAIFDLKSMGITHEGMNKFFKKMGQALGDLMPCTYKCQRG